MKKNDRKRAKELIRKIEKKTRELYVIPDSMTYIKLYQVLQELHFQGRYDLVIKICTALMDE